ncbi:MAG: transcriptional repressor [Crocinitomicaceae bacterium]|nr:transcriptional repressor [Crocinitomicaceae bacterium]
MIEILKSRNIRITDFRLVVLDILARHKTAISMEQIEEELGDFDRITLYRTIKTFIEKGVVHEILMPGNVKKLALCDDGCQDEHHHEHLHFQCNSCNEIYCVDIPRFPKVNLPGFKIDRMEIQAFGTCQQCLS